MSETPSPAAEAEVLCEKCRHRYPASHFDHGQARYTCICRRCLQVMGYPVKGQA